MAQRLAELIDGRVLEHGEAGFEDALDLFNVRLGHSPDTIAQCRDAEDVAKCVEFARNEGLTLSVKGGGHSYAANTVAAGGILVDLSPMKQIEVDLESRTVTAGGGVTCGELDQATQAHGLATPSPTVSSVGVAGAALGGGTGWLSRKHGLMSDNLVGVEVVTADGRTLWADEDQHSDLFWAMRGAGANFGIATSLRFRLHEVGPELLAGQIIYPFGDAGAMLGFYRDFMADAPDEFQCYPFMFRVPPVDPFPQELHGQPVIDFVLGHLDADAIDFVQPLRELGEPILDGVAPVPYTALQQSFDPNLPKGFRYYSKAHYVDPLSDDAIDTVVGHIPEVKGDFTAAYFEPLGGAIGQVAPTATAFPEREARFGFHILAGWIEEADDEPVMSWARDFHHAMAAHARDGVYVNLLADDEEDRVRAAYGDNYERLRELKGEWDPDNLFRVNHNIVPGP